MSTTEDNGPDLNELAPFCAPFHQGPGCLSPTLSMTSMNLSTYDMPTDQKAQPYEDIGMLHDTFPPNLSRRSACPSPSACVAPSRRKPTSPKRQRQQHPKAPPKPADFPCTWEGCTKLYSRTQDVRRHILSVSKPAQRYLTFATSLPPTR